MKLTSQINPVKPLNEVTRSVTSPADSGLTRRDLLKSMAGFGAIAALSNGTQITKASDGVTNSSTKRTTSKVHVPASAAAQSKVLAERAEDYLGQIFEVARGPRGLIISHSRFDTRQPLQEGEDLHPFLHQDLDSNWGKDAPKPTLADWYYGEDTLWATGWLLWSQMIRYRVTREAEAQRIARKCFQDLNHVFDLCRPIEPGLLGKPHGGRGGPTTSFDQAANPVLLYAEFARESGTSAEKEQALHNLLEHGNYYLCRNWQEDQHGNL